MEFYLPQPTDEELDLGKKTDYFSRLIEMELHKKYKITLDEFCFWIHHNYSSVFLTGNELNLNQVKKLNR